MGKLGDPWQVHVAVNARGEVGSPAEWERGEASSTDPPYYQIICRPYPCGLPTDATYTKGRQTQAPIRNHWELLYEMVSGRCTFSSYFRCHTKHVWRSPLRLIAWL